VVVNEPGPSWSIQLLLEDGTEPLTAELRELVERVAKKQLEGALAITPFIAHILGRAVGEVLPEYRVRVEGEDVLRVRVDRKAATVRISIASAHVRTAPEAA
jgi:hypothetical protein